MAHLILGHHIRLTKDSEALLLNLTDATALPKTVDAFNAWLQVQAAQVYDGSAEGRLLSALMMAYQTEPIKTRVNKPCKCR